jgi:HEPN domain-containing protein
MKPITQLWVDKAEGDWQVANRAWKARDRPVYDHVCFHSHECAEKYLKGRLVEADATFPKTHNLPHLLTLLLPIEPEWHVLEPDLLGLKVFGVSIVYPGKQADKADAENALRFCRAVREVARRSLELPI